MAPNPQLPKIELPIFRGQCQYHYPSPRYWLGKCRRYFALNRIDSGSDRILIAEMHMEGEADIWYAVNVEGKENRMSWEEFQTKVLERFRACGEEGGARGFDALQQVGTLEDYICEFEEVQAQLQAEGSVFDESELVRCFVTGLAGSLQSYVRLLKVRTVADAMHIAREFDNPPPPPPRPPPL